MRKLMVLIVLSFLGLSASAQNKAAVPMATAPATPEFLDVKLWSDLGKPTEGTRGFSLFTRNMQPKSDTLFEMWIRIVPVNAASFNKRFGLPRESAFVVQYATVDCQRRVVLLEKTTAFDASNGFVDARASDLVKNETRTRVKAGSVSETVFEYICLKLQ